MSTKDTPDAADIARSMSECMNLLFLMSAPRVFASVQASGLPGLEAPTVIASFRRFLSHASGIRGRATANEDELDRLIRSAILVEEITATVASAGLGDALPAALSQRARDALAILGMVEPKGGWDAFEGFVVQPPTPSTQPAPAALA
jgi:hypothetical protein